jgi:hypothetical protein
MVLMIKFLRRKVLLFWKKEIKNIIERDNLFDKKQIRLIYRFTDKLIQTLFVGYSCFNNSSTELSL